jgi:hypothetical protein
VAVLRLPARSPNLNAFAERFVLSVKTECLDRIVLLQDGVSGKYSACTVKALDAFVPAATVSFAHRRRCVMLGTSSELCQLCNVKSCKTGTRGFDQSRY